MLDNRCGDESVTYRIVFVRAGSRNIFTSAESTSGHLPRITVRRWARQTEQLCAQASVLLSVQSMVLELLVSDDRADRCAVMELRSQSSSLQFVENRVSEIPEGELDGHERVIIRNIVSGSQPAALSNPGWADEVLCWVRSITGVNSDQSWRMKQFNAGGGFQLVRIDRADGSRYWFKATGEPNRHEFGITELLSHVSRQFLPRPIGVKVEWNAWLAEDAGSSLADLGGAVSENCIDTLAKLQQSTVGHTEALLAAGSADHRVLALDKHVDVICDYLEQAMSRQTSAKVPVLSRPRIRELAQILHDATEYVAGLNLPDTLLHNDLNAGNILYDGRDYFLTDWSEAAVGNPLLLLERLCGLDKTVSRERALRIYGEAWQGELESSGMERAFLVAPLLAIYAYLFGRGDWFLGPSKVRPGFESYARSLARHMDRAASDPCLRRVLCRA